MAKLKNRLSARAVATLTQPGKHADGSGLYLDIDAQGRRRWIYRFTLAGRRREMGLGAASTTPLAEARRLCDEARRDLLDGRDPIEARNTKRDQSRKKTFGEIADKLIASKQSEWRNERHGAQWVMTLERYAAPLRGMPVDSINVQHILSVLTPLWQRAPETASRLRGRIESVLDAAKAQKLRSGENPATWRGNLEHLLPKRPRLAKAHHAALPYAEMPSFITRLGERETVSSLTLEFIALTACRLGEALGARWSEIDLDDRLWTIPAERMKSGKAHRVPLSSRAIEILRRLHSIRTNETVFPGAGGGQLSRAAVRGVLKALEPTATIHGFRSSFRDWAGNETHFPREICEAALAHVVGNSVEQAYRRSDAIEKRRQLMDAWARHCEPREAGANVLPLFGRRAGE